VKEKLIQKKEYLNKIMGGYYMVNLKQVFSNIEKSIKGKTEQQAKSIIYTTLKPFRKTHNLTTQFLIDSANNKGTIEVYLKEEEMPIYYFNFKYNRYV
jgi:translation elongation factor EF-Ts